MENRNEKAGFRPLFLGKGKRLPASRFFIIPSTDRFKLGALE
jgi:hypothetical protein